MLNTNQEIILNALFALNTTAEARDSVVDVLSAAQFNSGLGALKRMGYIEKKEDGNYALTQAAHDEIEFEETAQPVQTESVQVEEIKEVEGVVVAAEVMVIDNTPVESEVIDVEVEVVSEVDTPLVELYAPMVYSHYQPVKAMEEPKKTRKASKSTKVTMNDDEFDHIVNITMATLNATMGGLTIRSTEEKPKVTYIRFDRNAAKIRAIEIHKSGIFRVYAGGKIGIEALHEELASMVTEIKDGSHWYYNFELSETMAGDVTAACTIATKTQNTKAESDAE